MVMVQTVGSKKLWILASDRSGVHSHDGKEGDEKTSYCRLPQNTAIVIKSNDLLTAGEAKFVLIILRQLVCKKKYEHR